MLSLMMKKIKKKIRLCRERRLTGHEENSIHAGRRKGKKKEQKEEMEKEVMQEIACERVGYVRNRSERGEEKK